MDRKLRIKLVTNRQKQNYRALSERMKLSEIISEANSTVVFAPDMDDVLQNVIWSDSVRKKKLSASYDYKEYFDFESACLDFKKKLHNLDLCEQDCYLMLSGTALSETDEGNICSSDLPILLVQMNVALKIWERLIGGDDKGNDLFFLIILKNRQAGAFFQSGEGYFADGGDPSRILYESESW